MKWGARIDCAGDLNEARAVDIMEFCNPTETTKRAKTARELCLTVLRLLTCAIQNVSDDKLVEELNALRAPAVRDGGMATSMLSSCMQDACAQTRDPFEVAFIDKLADEMGGAN